MSSSFGGLTYINWDAAMTPRSFGQERITGDVKAHYGAVARIVLIQMLTNHVVDLRILYDRNDDNNKKKKNAANIVT